MGFLASISVYFFLSLFFKDSIKNGYCFTATSLTALISLANQCAGRVQRPISRGAHRGNAVHTDKCCQQLHKCFMWNLVKTKELALISSQSFQKLLIFLKSVRAFSPSAKDKKGRECKPLADRWHAGHPSIYKIQYIQLLLSKSEQNWYASLSSNLLCKRSERGCCNHLKSSTAELVRKILSQCFSTQKMELF